MYNLTARDCQFIDGRYTVLSASFINPASKAAFYDCLMRTNSDVAQIYNTMPSVHFERCSIEGSGVDIRDTTSLHETSFKSCSFTNHINGDVSQFTRYVGNYGLVEDCSWDIIASAKISANQLFSVLAGDVTTSPPYPQKGAFRFNRITLRGNQDLSTAGSNGRIGIGYIQFFYDMDFRVSASGLTGTTPLEIDTGGSSVNQRGITSDSALIVDSNTGTSTQMPSGGYLLPRTMSVSALSLSPQVDNVMTIGSSSRTVSDIYMGTSAGIRMKDSNGKVWRLTVTTSGASLWQAV